MLVVVRAYSSQKDYEGLEWESVKSKYEDIRKELVTLYKIRYFISTRVDEAD